jgi:hypothetical protein
MKLFSDILGESWITEDGYIVDVGLMLIFTWYFKGVIEFGWFYIRIGDTATSINRGLYIYAGAAMGCEHTCWPNVGIRGSFLNFNVKYYLLRKSNGGKKIFEFENNIIRHRR